LQFDIGISVSEVDLNALFNRNGTWATGLNHGFVQSCLNQQRESHPAPNCDMMNDLAQQSMTADRRWVARFVEQHQTELTLQKRSVLERSRCEIGSDHLE
jgi:hypothetical protein